MINEYRKGPHLSASAIADYMECSLSYRLSRIDKIKPEFKSDSMELGSCVHLSLADFHQERLMGTIMTLEQLQERFKYHWTLRAFENTEIKYKQENSFESLLKQGKLLLKIYYENFSNDNTILAIEEPFRFMIDGLPVPIVGVIDLIEEDQAGNIIITDFKTPAKSPTELDVRKNPQLTLYHLASKSNGYKNRNIKLKLDCLIKTKTPQFKPYYTERNDWDELKIIKKIKEVWGSILKGIFIPNDTSWKCAECYYQTACENWYREN
jgi:putative RecB family exonuclease